MGTKTETVSTAAGVIGLIGFALTAFPPLKISWYWLRIHKRERDLRDGPASLRRKIEQINNSIAKTLGRWSTTDHYMLVSGITLQFFAGLMDFFV